MGLAAAYPTDRPLSMGSWAADSETERIALLTRFGFQPARYFFEMVRPSLDEIEQPVMPDGIEVRPVSEAQLRQLWEADIEAFRDHWGGFDGSEERFQQWLHDPKFDPEPVRGGLGRRRDRGRRDQRDQRHARTPPSAAARLAAVRLRSARVAATRFGPAIVLRSLEVFASAA